MVSRSPLNFHRKIIIIKINKTRHLSRVKIIIFLTANSRSNFYSRNLYQMEFDYKENKVLTKKKIGPCYGGAQKKMFFRVLSI